MLRAEKTPSFLERFFLVLAFSKRSFDGCAKRIQSRSLKNGKLTR